MAARLPKKAWDMNYMGFYTGGGHPTMMWAMAHTTFWTFLTTHFMSLHANIGTQYISVEMRVETESWGKWQPCNQDWRP